jgi:hypothetical protein
MLKPTVADLLIRQGSTEVWRFVTRNLDNDLYTASGFRLQVRATKDAATTLLDYTALSPEVTIGAGYIEVEIPETDTEPLTPGNAVYDAEAQDPASTRWWRIAQGCVVIDGLNVTR